MFVDLNLVDFASKICNVQIEEFGNANVIEPVEKERLDFVMTLTIPWFLLNTGG